MRSENRATLHARAFAAAQFLLAAVTTTPVCAADMSQIGPQVGAAQLIAAHGSTPEPALRIAYSVQADPDKSSHPMIVEIAPDFVFVKGAQETLFDYKLRREIVIDEARKTFANLSLFMMTDFRYVESYNRRMQRSVLAKLGASGMSPDMKDAFWNEQELGIADPLDGPVSVNREPTQSGGTRFVVDNLDAAEFESSNQVASDSEMKGVAHLLREIATLHPIVTDAIVASGKVPSRLSFLVIRGGHKTQTEWHLQSVERVSAAYPLPAEFGPDVAGASTQSTEMKHLAPIMLAAVARTYNSGPRSAESYQAVLADTFKRGDMFQNYLLDSEFALQYGQGTSACLNRTISGPSCASAQDIGHAWLADEKTRTLLQSFAIEQHDPKKALDMRAALRRGDLTDAYVFDGWTGNAMTESGDIAGATSEIAKAIEGNPYVPSFYKDLGDAYRRDFDPVSTWLCYDLARALPTSSSAPVVSMIDRIEDDLVSRYPQFF